MRTFDVTFCRLGGRIHHSIKFMSGREFPFSEDIKRGSIHHTEFSKNGIKRKFIEDCLELARKNYDEETAWCKFPFDTIDDIEFVNICVDILPVLE